MKLLSMITRAIATELADCNGVLPGSLIGRKIRMKLTFALLLMATTLGAGSAVLAAGQGRLLLPEPNISSRAAPDAALIQIDDDGDEGADGWFWSSSDDDDDEDEDCEEDDDDGEETGCAAGATGTAAKAGTVAPPQNGLFTNGTAPVVKSN